MPYPISDIASNFALYNKVYERSTVLHDKTANTIRVADGITAYNSLSIVRGRVEVTPVNANLVYAGPASGATPANPTFRALVAADLPAGTGTVTSVGIAAPVAVFAVSGSPVTTSGTLTLAFQTQTQNTFFSAPNGATGTPTFRSIVPADLGTGGALNRVLTHDGSGGMAWVAPATPTTIITVGTTSVTSGTVGRVFFQGSGNVVQQAANLFYDNTNSRLSLAMGGSPGARLDILNPGTTSSDLAIRVRSNGNTFNNFEIRGNGVAVFAGFSANAGYIVPFNSGGTTGFILTTENLVPNPSSVTLANIFITDTYVQTRASISGVSRRVLRFETAYTGSDPDWVMASYGGDVGGSLALGKIAGTAMFAWSAERVFSIAPNAYLNNGTNQLRIVNGTAPTATLADGFSLYSADIVANNAAPHFRTEGGDVVKLYSVGGWGTPTGTLTRTTFDTATVTLAELAQRVAALISDLRTGHQLLKA